MTDNSAMFGEISTVIVLGPCMISVGSFIVKSLNSVNGKASYILETET